MVMLWWAKSLYQLSVVIQLSHWTLQTKFMISVRCNILGQPFKANSIDWVLQCAMHIILCTLQVNTCIASLVWLTLVGWESIVIIFPSWNYVCVRVYMCGCAQWWWVCNDEAAGLLIRKTDNLFAKKYNFIGILTPDVISFRILTIPWCLHCHF